MDDNDIVFNSYGPDLVQVFSKVFHSATDNQFWWNDIVAWFLTIWSIWSVVAFLLSLLFIAGIIYSYIRLNQLTEIESERLLENERMWQQVYGEGARGDKNWQDIQSHLASENPNDWKLAIIEADIMLDKVLQNAGFAGNSVGERLKSASPVNFTTLQDAWDAHIIRNKIAHDGGDFVFTHRIAKEAIIKYQRVFSEFGVM